MRFHEASNFIFDLRRFPSRPGTAATADLLAHLDDPHQDLTCVQVAGSNGKGSTARMVESTLREAGLDVGLYTSPHFDDIRERITTNGRKISESALTAFVESIQSYVTDRATEGEAPTFFETLTCLALWEFEQQDVDVAVLEVGIGGKYDATSAVDPVASAVTSVSLEHTEMLGDDVGTIARDKAHVAPDGRPLVTGATGEALSAIQDQVGETLVVGGEEESEQSGSKPDVTVEYGGRDGIEGVASIDGPDWHVETQLPLVGAHQARNAAIAGALVRQLASLFDADLGTETVARGLRNAHWLGRFEIMGQDPLVVLDGAHNPRGCQAVADTLGEFEFDDLHLVIGAMTDKDHQGIASALGAADSVVACEPDTDRAESRAVLARVFEQETAASVQTRVDVAGALNDTLERAKPTDCVLVTGSLYTVGEARTRWCRATIPKRLESIPDASDTLEAAHVTDQGTWRMRGEAVHRVLKTRVQPRQAQYIKEKLLSLGGECAVSGIEHKDEEKVAIVMMGTMAEFKRFCQKLDDEPFGLSPLADELRGTLGIGIEPTEYPWGRDTAIMGVLNVTPDSFHDGGEYEAQDDAIRRGEEMVEAGADIVDVGGESTRPGAEPVPVEEERSRVIPVVEALADLDTLVSIDTRKTEVARAALDAGADILNDVSGLEDPEMRLVAADRDVPVIVMHSIDTPVVPEKDIHYDDVVEDVIDELTERILLAEKAGLDRSQIIVDPGLGFGKTAAEGFELLDRIDEFRGLGCPVLVGHSHKSMFEHIDRGPEERYEPTIAATALAAERGADIVRVHDVAANVAAVDVVDAASNGEQGPDEPGD